MTQGAVCLKINPKLAKNTCLWLRQSGTLRICWEIKRRDASLSVSAIRQLDTSCPTSEAISVNTNQKPLYFFFHFLIVISFERGHERCRHFVITQNKWGQFTMRGDCQTYDTLTELIEFYKVSPIQPFREYLTSSCFQVRRSLDRPKIWPPTLEVTCL